MTLPRTASQSSQVQPLSKHLFYAEKLLNLCDSFNNDEFLNFATTIKPTLSLFRLESLTSNMLAIIDQFNARLSLILKCNLSTIDDLIQIYLVEHLQPTIDSIINVLYEYESSEELPIDVDVPKVIRTHRFVKSTLMGQGIQLDSFKLFLVNQNKL